MFGVICARGVTLTSIVAVISCVGVGDFIPTNVGVCVNVNVGVTGVGLGMGVYVFVDVSDGVDVTDGPREKPPTEQDKDKTTQARMI